MANQIRKIALELGGADVCPFCGYPRWYDTLEEHIKGSLSEDRPCAASREHAGYEFVTHIPGEPVSTRVFVDRDNDPWLITLDPFALTPITFDEANDMLHKAMKKAERLIADINHAYRYLVYAENEALRR